MANEDKKDFNAMLNDSKDMPKIPVDWMVGQREKSGGIIVNFIDVALTNRNNLSDDDFLQAMAGIYKEPEVWDILDTYPQYVQDVIYIIDYDTELQMEGLEGVLEGHMSENYPKIYNALINSGALDEAHILHEARNLDIECDNYDEQIIKLEKQTALYNDYEFFWTLVRNYIGRNRIPSP